MQPSKLNAILFFSLVYLFSFGLGEAEGFALKIEDSILVKFPTGFINQSEFTVGYQSWLDQNPSLVSHLPKNYNRYLVLAIKLKQLTFLAQEQGIDQTSNFSSTLKKHFENMKQAGILQKDVMAWSLYEAYIRQHFVVNASHILVADQQSATTRKDLVALRKARQFRGELLSNNNNFGEFARLNSDDPSSAQNHGKLGYFTVFDRIKPLEDAAYETQVGMISEPIKSRFGFHLVKVHSRNKLQGLKRASHILIKHITSDESIDSESANLAGMLNKKLNFASCPARDLAAA